MYVLVNSKSIELLNKKIKTMDKVIDEMKNESIIIMNGTSKERKSIIKELAKNKTLIKITNQIYVDVNWSINDFLLRQLILKQGIYSGITALYLWNLTDEYPYRIHMTFKMGYRLPQSYFEWTENVQAHQIKKNQLNDNTTFQSVEGTNYKIKLYNRERTLVDILKDPVEENIVNVAYRRYLQSDTADKNKLLEIAYSMGSLKKVKSRLEKY